MTENPAKSPPEPDAQETLSDQQKWEFEERISGLERQLAEKTEQEQLHELEVTSLRHELDLRVAYNHSLEQLAGERLREIDWLRSEIEYVRNRLTQEADANHNRTTRRVGRSVRSVARRSRLLTAVFRRLRRFVHEST